MKVEQVNTGSVNLCDTCITHEDEKRRTRTSGLTCSVLQVIEIVTNTGVRRDGLHAGHWLRPRHGTQPVTVFDTLHGIELTKAIAAFILVRSSKLELPPWNVTCAGNVC